MSNNNPFDLSGTVAVVTGGGSGIGLGMAGVAVYLASSASSYHTGDVLRIDGG